MKTIALMMCLSLISGCASLQQMKQKLATLGAKNSNKHGSYVSPEISDSDAEELSRDMSQFLMNQLPAAKTTLELDSLKSPFHSMLREELAYKGFGIVEGNLAIQHGVRLRYLVTPFDWGLLVRLRYQDKEASRFYDRNIDGHLSFHTAFTVREAIK